MKKFSKITNTKVGEEPKKDIKINEEDLFKYKVMNLMNEFLSIQTYGPIDRYLRAGTIKIAGKELFTEALLNVMSDKSLKEQSKLLENLKSTITNWEAIDEKIDDVKFKIETNSENNKMLIHKSKLISMYEKYKDDEELLLKMSENNSNKIKDKDNAHLRAITAEFIANERKYPKEIFEKISEKYYTRADILK